MEKELEWLNSAQKVQGSKTNQLISPQKNNITLGNGRSRIGAKQSGDYLPQIVAAYYRNYIHEKDPEKLSHDCIKLKISYDNYN